MFIEVSVGEAIDKLNILEIKTRKIKNEEKQREIQKEIVALDACKSIISANPKYYEWLTFVNTKIWDYTDVIKGMPVADPSFAMISNEIFEENQKRFRIKSFFNNIANSNIKEQKSYSASRCHISIPTEEILYDKIPEINYLSIAHDVISFDTPFVSIVKTIFKQPNIIYDDAANDSSAFSLVNYKLNPDDMAVFENTPIKYVCGGLLGDFIQSISVVNENFLKTGKKVLFILRMIWVGKISDTALKIHTTILKKLCPNKNTLKIF